MLNIIYLTSLRLEFLFNIYHLICKVCIVNNYIFFEESKLPNQKEKKEKENYKFKKLFNFLKLRQVENVFYFLNLKLIILGSSLLDKIYSNLHFIICIEPALISNENNNDV